MKFRLFIIWADWTNKIAQGLKTSPSYSIAKMLKIRLRFVKLSPQFANEVIVTNPSSIASIRLIRDKKGLYKFPDPKFLVGSNFCDIGFDFDEDNNRLIALSASDNLMKGAAGSAIQNMNVMCGFDEMSGLRYTPLTPV